VKSLFPSSGSRVLATFSRWEKDPVLKIPSPPKILYRQNMSKNSAITHIADTALWVATYRARESKRPDALFHDRLADLLAGERGRSIAADMPYSQIMEWALVLRTVAIDDLVMRAISLGADTVVDLGAGLDTRPYRMVLPPNLRWIEVDFPQMISYKSEKLVGQHPVCRLDSIAADLTDLPLRRAIFKRIDSESQRALIITEGVIAYMTAADAEVLSKDLLDTPSFQYWIQDYYQGGTQRWAPRRMRERLKETPFRFEEKDWLSFFQKHGWKILENRYASDESIRLHRPFPFVFPWSLVLRLLPQHIKEQWRRSSGYVLYEKPISKT
jgi:methyltransferase (TIGR00027 family)